MRALQYQDLLDKQIVHCVKLIRVVKRDQLTRYIYRGREPVRISLLSVEWSIIRYSDCATVFLISAERPRNEEPLPVMPLNYIFKRDQ